MTDYTNLSIDATTTAVLDAIWKKELKPLGIRKSYAGTVRYVAKNHGVSTADKAVIYQVMVDALKEMKDPDLNLFIDKVRERIAAL